MTDKVALFDMDGVLADYDWHMGRDLLEISNGDELPENLHSDELPDWLGRRKRLISSQPGWWRGLSTTLNGLELMKLCSDIGYNIHILTQGPRGSMYAWKEKFEWCDDHVAPIVPDYGISITRNGKSLHYGRVLVEDYPLFMSSWLEHRPRGLGVMPTFKDNESFEHPQVVRYDPASDEWRTPELEDKLHAAFNRKSGEDMS